MRNRRCCALWVPRRPTKCLFALSYDYVGDLAEALALVWRGHEEGPVPTLSEVVTTLRGAAVKDVPEQISTWLNRMDATGRWALLKLITGALRVGVSARLAKTALAQFGDVELDEIEQLLAWPRAALCRSLRPG